MLPPLLCWLALTACQSGEETRSKRPANSDAATQKHGLSQEQAAQTLVQVGGTRITVGDFAERLAEQSPYLQARYSNPQRRREFLDSMVEFELLSAEAKRKGYMERQEIQRTRKQVMIQQMMKSEFEDAVKLSDISEDQIKAYYEANPGEFNKPRQVRASHILIKDPRKARKTLAKVLAAPRNNKLFRELAAQLNEDPATQARRGDLQFFSVPGPVDQTATSAPAVPRTVAQAAFRLENIGDVFPELLESEAGLHIVKLTGKRAALARSLDHARRPIQNKLWRQKRDQAIEDFVTGLRAAAAIEENPDMLRNVRIPGGRTFPATPDKSASKPAIPEIPPSPPTAP